MSRSPAPRPAARRPRDGEDGFAMSSPVALMCGAAVVLAGVAFWLTDPVAETPGRAVLAAAGPAAVEPQVVLEARAVKPTVKRDEIYVDVFNNTNITGLAAGTADRITGAGWRVVSSDNWYGTIPATTIYYPERLGTAARMLAKDLGIDRVLPAVDPMNRDRLTLILTADWA